MCFFICFIVNLFIRLTQLLLLSSSIWFKREHCASVCRCVQELAVRCVQEMLRDNLQMLQTKVRQREIDIFVKLLVEAEMSVTFLRLLQSTCSCPMGVDSTQRMVTFALFDPTNGDRDLVSSDPIAVAHPTIISLQAMPTSPEYPPRKIDWQLEQDIYISSELEVLGQIKGRELLYDGMPHLFLTWNNNPHDDDSRDLSMMKLFHQRVRVALVDFCAARGGDRGSLQGHSSSNGTRPLASSASGSGRIAGPSSSSSSSPTSFSVEHENSFKRVIRRRNSAAMIRTTLVIKRGNRFGFGKSGHQNLIEQINQIQDFFVEELYVVADLCLDRNYVAIGILEKMFGYNELLTMLMSDVPNRVKAPVCRILKCMYVDREPQVEAIFPRLIRTSVSLKGGDENNFNDFHPGSPFHFAMLQKVISVYIQNSLDATKCDDLSAEMMDLLQSIIKFGYYHKPAHLRDILQPLVGALDNHRFSAVRNRLRAEKRKRMRDRRDSMVGAQTVRRLSLLNTAALPGAAYAINSSNNKKGPDDDIDDDRPPTRFEAFVTWWEDDEKTWSQVCAFILLNFVNILIYIVNISYSHVGNKFAQICRNGLK